MADNVSFFGEEKFERWFFPSRWKGGGKGGHIPRYKQFIAEQYSGPRLHWTLALAMILALLRASCLLIILLDHIDTPTWLQVAESRLVLTVLYFNLR